MAEQMRQAGNLAQARSVLVCRLRWTGGRSGRSPTAGEVELENVSTDVVEIEVDMHPLQYLQVVVTDSAGGTVPAPPYGNLFSPLGKTWTLRLAPGEKYAHNISLMGNVPPPRQVPGTYTVRAIYEYRGLRAVSDPLPVQLPAQGK